MSIRTKFRLNMMLFAVLAAFMIRSEAQLMLADEVRAFLALPILNGIA